MNQPITALLVAGMFFSSAPFTADVVFAEDVLRQRRRVEQPLLPGIRVPGEIDHEALIDGIEPVWISFGPHSDEEQASQVIGHLKVMLKQFPQVTFVEESAIVSENVLPKVWQGLVTILGDEDAVIDFVVNDDPRLERLINTLFDLGHKANQLSRRMLEDPFAASLAIGWPREWWRPLWYLNLWNPRQLWAIFRFRQKRARSAYNRGLVKHFHRLSETERRQVTVTSEKAPKDSIRCALKSYAYRQRFLRQKRFGPTLTALIQFVHWELQEHESRERSLARLLLEQHEAMPQQPGLLEVGHGHTPLVEYLVEAGVPVRVLDRTPDRIISSAIQAGVPLDALDAFVQEDAWRGSVEILLKLAFWELSMPWVNREQFGEVVNEARRIAMDVLSRLDPIACRALAQYAVMHLHTIEPQQAAVSIVRWLWCEQRRLGITWLTSANLRSLVIQGSLSESPIPIGYTPSVQQSL